MRTKQARVRLSLIKGIQKADHVLQLQMWCIFHVNDAGKLFLDVTLAVNVGSRDMTYFKPIRTRFVKHSELGTDDYTVQMKAFIIMLEYNVGKFPPLLRSVSRQYLTNREWNAVRRNGRKEPSAERL